MSWQRLAFRSSAALLVTPSALFASCYLPMGTFDSDSIQIPFEPSAQFRQEVASSDSPFQEGAPTGPRHLAPIEWKRGTLGVPLHGGSHVDQSGTFTGASASPPLSNGGARYWPAEHKSSGDQSPSSAIDRLKKWLGAAKEEGHLTAPLLTSQQAGSAADCGSLPNGWSSMTASQRKVDNRRDTAGQKNGGEIRHTEANSEGLRTKAATDVYATKSSNSVGLEESNVDLSADRQEYDTQLEPGSALASGLRLNVLILVIGTRGDVQPMAALGRVLQEKYGHRVRVATHAPFKDAVEAQGLEFFPMPGNPNFLIDKMVNSSTSAQWSLPSSPSAILAVRRWFKGIIFSHWPACTAPAPLPGQQPVPIHTARASEAPHWSLNVAANDASTGSESGASLPSSFRKVEAEGRSEDADDIPGIGTRSMSGQSVVPPQPAPSATLQPAGLTSDVSTRVATSNGSSEAATLPASLRADLKSAEFTPDLIVATPTTQVALSCAQALGIPLHVFYLMPYTRTRHLPHPLSGGSLPGPDGSKATRFSWSLIESVSACGVWDYVNRFRRQVLRLPLLPRGALSEFFLLEALAVPTTYAFSRDLVPRPSDWGDNIRIVNYVYDDNLTSRYQPSPLLQRFLDAGPPPVYIGFGSMKLDHTDDVMDTLVTAVRAAGVRAVIHKRGWADDVDQLQKRLAAFGTHRRGPRKSMDARKDRSASMDSADDGGLRGRRASGSFVSDDDILVYEEEVPHGWLFPRCQAVVTHGGAGTVGAALRAGKPVMVVPFWGDQFLWGQLVAAAGVGPSAVPVSKLTEEALASGLEEMSNEDVIRAAARLGEQINNRENGVLAAAAHIQSSLPLEALRCDACGERAARAWACHKLQKLCPACLQDLAQNASKPPEVLPYHSLEWRLSRPRGDCCGLRPETVFTPEQMREAGWRSSTAVRRVVGEFRSPQADERRKSPADSS